MYDLDNLEGLILSLIYSELESDTNDGYDKIKGQVEQEIIRYTNYSVALINNPDYAEVKSQLLRPYAWILEYYALALNPSLSDLQVNRIHKNYKEAKEMLESLPKYYDDGDDADSANTFDCDGVVEW